MPFFKPKPLPRTSYGYQPPPEAVDVRWVCATHGCGRVGDGVPRRWPYACPACGGATDPYFAEPWQHDARGVEIQYLLANNVQDGGFTETQWSLWRFKDALRRGDGVAAADARAEFRAKDVRERAESDNWIPGYGYFYLVWDALEAGELDAAADDLIYWLSVSDASGVESHNSRRTNCRQAIECALRFFATPGAAGHPQAAAVRKRCLDLAAGCSQVLTGEAQTGVARLSSV